MNANLMAKKEMRKTSLVLWAVSFALLMQAHPLWAMNDKSEIHNQSTKRLRGHNYYKAELQKLEESTRRIHQGVNGILREFSENMEEYRKHTRGKGVASKSVVEVVTKKSQQSSLQDRVDSALALAMSEGLDVIKGKDESAKLADLLKYRLEHVPFLPPAELVEELARARRKGSYDQMMSTWVVQPIAPKQSKAIQSTENQGEVDTQFLQSYMEIHPYMTRDKAITEILQHQEAEKQLEEQRQKGLNQQNLRDEKNQSSTYILGSQMHRPSSSKLQETKQEWTKLWMKFTKTLTQVEVYQEGRYQGIPKSLMHIYGGNLTDIELKNLREDLQKNKKEGEEKGISQEEEDEIIELTSTDPDTQKTVSFLTCPTIGDGDCFFHAAFTEDGEILEDVTKKAADMRENLWQSIQNDEAAKKLIPFAAVESVESMKTQENVEGVRQYMKQLRKLDGFESFIPLDISEKIIVQPAQQLAIQGKKQIRIFIRDPGADNPRTTHKLIHVRTVGNPNDPIVNLLQSGAHYTRLYTGDENEERDCIAIIQNSMYKRGLKTLDTLKEIGESKENISALKKALNKLLEAY